MHCLDINHKKSTLFGVVIHHQNYDDTSSRTWPPPRRLAIFGLFHIQLQNIVASKRSDFPSALLYCYFLGWEDRYGLHLSTVVPVVSKPEAVHATVQNLIRLYRQL